MVVVLWVWAKVEAMATPQKAIMAPNVINVFISNIGLGSICVSEPEFMGSI